MNRWREYNPNPRHNTVGDCTTRALTKATGEDWDTIYLIISAYGFDMKNMPSANRVWGRYLYNKGFREHAINNYGDKFYTVEDFCIDHSKGTYILHIPDPGHVVCVVDGFYWDSWDSGGEVPQYYWEREV